MSRSPRKRPKHHGPAHPEFHPDIAPALARQLAREADDAVAVLRTVSRADLIEYVTTGRRLIRCSRDAVGAAVLAMQMRRAEAEAYAEDVVRHALAEAERRVHA